MTTLEVPQEANGSAQSPSKISIVVDDVDQDLNGNLATGDQEINDKSIEELTREDLGLKGDERDDVYDGLIRDFRTKMDSLSFRRLNKTDIKAQAADFLAQKDHGNEKGGEHKTFKKRSNRTLMLPAVKFQDLDDDETMRRDTGSSDHSRASGASYLSDKSRRRFKNKNQQFGRRKSVMGHLMKRGRTMRKTLRAMHINDEGRTDSAYGVPPTNEQKLRMFVLKEIFDTETEYMKLLQFMSEVIAPYLEEVGNDPNRAHSCNSETATQLLSNVKEIHNLHVDFHSEMENVFIPAPFHTHCIGKLFLRFKDRFGVYDEYCGNFNKAQKLCYELEKDPDLKETIKTWKSSVESKSRRFLHLEGFAISPVQRLCKYPLFLKELKKYTPSNHRDYDDVVAAQKVMEGVTAAVNESEKRQLMIQAIRDMESLCDTWEQSGFVSKQGFLTKRGGSVKSWYIRWFILRGYKLAYYHEPTDLRPLGVLDLTSYKSVEPDASEQAGRPFAFSIKMPERTFYMYATSEEEKQEWLNTLQWKFDCIERSRRQSHHPFETVVFSSISSFIHPKSRRSETGIEVDSNDEGVGDAIHKPTILSPTEEVEEVFTDEKTASGSNDEGKPVVRSVSAKVTFSDEIVVDESSPKMKSRGKSKSECSKGKAAKQKKSKRSGKKD